MIAGLGNPGREYEGTRHNVGFLFLDQLVADCGTASGAWKARGSAEIAEVRIGEHRLLLVKPLSYMNRSGEVVEPILMYYKVAVADLIVAHDDADLILGRIHLKLGGGDGGHNGIRSVAQLTGTKDFLRLRLGIGRPVVKSAEQLEHRAKMDLAPWVLGRFAGEERESLGAMLKKGVEAIRILCDEGVTKAQNKINRMQN